MDYLLLTETWLKPAGDEVRVSQMTPNNFTTHSFPRLTTQPEDRQAGGISLTFRNLFDPFIKNTCNVDFPSFELSRSQITLRNNDLVLFCIYRPPPSSKNKLTCPGFIHDFEVFLDSYTVTLNNFLIIGDINLHFDNPNETYCKRFIDLLEVRNLTQLIFEPTHKAGHILDWLITRNEKHDSIMKIRVKDLCISDHFLITFTIDFKKPKRPVKEIMSRNMRAISYDDLSFDLALSCATCVSLSDACKATLFTSEIAAVFDRHAPLRARSVSQRPSAPWLTGELKSLKAEKRRAERQWLRTGLSQHKLLYRQLLAKFKNLVSQAKKVYYESKILASSTSRNLFQFVSEMYGNGKKCILPNNVPLDKMPEIFNDFFISKIGKIRSILDSRNNGFVSNTNSFTGEKFQSFQLLSCKQVKHLILSSPCKSCCLDPLPTNILFQNIDLFIDCITSIVNDSLANGIMPLCYRKAVISPLLKKPNLDVNELKNYRPVSNLPFLSKIIEKAVALQLNEHLNKNKLFEQHQSAYRKCHNTETALVKISNDLLLSADNKNVSILVLLDLSAAFDTIDHCILIDRLKDCFGLDGTVLNWLKSYLTERKQCVKINSSFSSELPLLFGVPQGSVLGPLLYTLYTAPLGFIIKSHNLNYHFYADDSQLYLSIKPSNVNDLVFSLEKCILEVKDWMEKNKLKLNEEKTEVVLINPKNYDVNISSLKIGDEDIIFNEKAKNLGVYLDKDLNMNFQITNLSKAIYLEIRKLKHISKFVSNSCLKTLAASFILSRLDYCNALYKNLNKYQIDQLQKLQNFAAKVVMSKSLYDHVTPCLIELHWLPVSFRIDYKIAVLSFKCLHNLAPTYLSDLIEEYHPSRNLRSSTQKLLKKKVVKFEKLGKKSFAYSAPQVWNSLPFYLRNETSLEVFKKKLKTFYFEMAYH